MSQAQPSNKQIAITIVEQLGGSQFLLMTGTNQIVYDHNSVTMRLTRNKIGATHLRITLNSMDLYDMKFIRVRKMEVKTLKEHNGVYDDMLAEIFTDETGLYTKLF